MRVALLCCAIALVPISSASARPAAQPCWQVLMADWYDGAISKVYPIDCYRQAVAHLPNDIAVYSSARDDILRAMSAAAKGETTIPAESGDTPVPVTADSQSSGKHGIAKLFDRLSPGNPDSFPLPLLILGALAILLIIAGGVGMVVRRNQNSDSDSSS
ncbi:MAG: hypothetical protein WCH31_00655 [Actinomycetes bacterium]